MRQIVAATTIWIVYIDAENKRSSLLVSITLSQVYFPVQTYLYLGHR
jgi:hypothetical protein